MTPLRQRMIEDMQLRNLGTETQRAYLHYIAGLARFYQTSPEHLEPRRHSRIPTLPDQRAPLFAGVGQQLRLRRQVPLQRHPGNALAGRRPPALPRPQQTCPSCSAPAEVDRVLPTRPHHSLPRRPDDLPMAPACASPRWWPCKFGDIDSKRMLLRVRPGQRQQGPLRHALASPAGKCSAAGGAPSIPPDSAHRLPEDWLFPWMAPRPSHERRISPDGLPRSRPRRRHQQARHRPHAAPQLRHSPAGKRHRHPRHPGPARP